MIPTLVLLPLIGSLCTLASAQVTVKVSATAPSDASATVNPSFVAWAFEERSFLYFAGNFRPITCN